MSSKVERERRKAQLLSQIQQQRLDLSATRREWLEATGAYDRRWNMLLSLRSWALVGSSVMAIWTIRHPNMLVRWARRGFGGVWSAWRLVKTSGENNPQATTASRLTSSLAGEIPLTSSLAGEIPALSLKFFENI